VPTKSLAIAAVDQQLANILSAELDARAGEYGAEATLLADAAREAVAGGKRMRAQFAIAGWSAVAKVKDANAKAPEELWQLCASLELFQAAALVHDDLIDNSDTRRNRPSAHRALEARHKELGWAGDPAQFGRAAAVLLGDLLVALSDDALEDAIASHPDAASLRAVYRQMRQDVTVGQFLDIAEESAWALHPDEQHAERARRVIDLKSARYSIQMPLALGATLAGADSEQLQALQNFGAPLGMAFQLRDDVLGVFGDPAVTGKPVGGDLREGKRTVLIALTRTSVPAGTRATIDELLGDQGLDDAQISLLQETIRASGALAEVGKLVDHYTQSAEQSLSGARLDNSAVNELRALARAATDRRS
jgi:geranylgeranyl diphosphate synthase type I